MKTNKPCYKFGSYDTKTEEFQEGYVENNEMKFRRLPWWKRIFQRRIVMGKPKVSTEQKFDCTAMITAKNAFGQIIEYKVSVYKEIDYTETVINVFTVGGNTTHYLDINAWENGRQMVFI